MPQSASGERETATGVVPYHPHRLYRSDPSDCLEGGNSVEGSVTVEALRAAIDTSDDPGCITGAIVTLRRVEGEQSQYRLYVQCSWLGGQHFGVAVHRGKALRVHKTFDPWILLLDAFGYSGPVCVYREPDPALAPFNLVGRIPAP